MVGEEREYEIYDGGLAKKWCVRRLKDGKNFKEGCETKQEADSFLMNWLKGQGRKAA